MYLPLVWSVGCLRPQKLTLRLLFFCRDLRMKKIVSSSSFAMFIVYFMQIRKFYTVWFLRFAL